MKLIFPKSTEEWNRSTWGDLQGQRTIKENDLQFIQKYQRVHTIISGKLGTLKNGKTILLLWKEDEVVEIELINKEKRLKRKWLK